MSDTFQINLLVGDKHYPLTIKRVDEEKFRTAARLINEKIDQYKKAFSASDKTDYLAMAAIQLVTELVEIQSNLDVSPVFEMIRDLDSDLENTIKNIP